MCALSALVETAQFLVVPGRDSTLGDVVTNTIGGALGFALARYTWIWLRPSPQMATILTMFWCATWLAIQSISNYGFAPSLPDSRYYGQLARAIGNSAVFEGRVIDASAGDVVIPNSAFADSHVIRRALLNGAAVVTTVVPAGPTREIVPIVRVADEEQREIVLLAQQQANLLFRIRSGADVLRLRRPLFALPHVFPAEDVGEGNFAADTARLTARYVAREVTMSAQTTLGTRHRRAPLTASLGWTLVLPFDWLLEGTRAELVLGCIWTACMLIPLGYWTARIAPQSRTSGIVAHLTPVLFGLLLMAVGFLLIPSTFGISAASLGEWLCAWAGIFIGRGLAARMAEPMNSLKCACRSRPN